MNLHQNHLDAKKSLGKDSTKPPSYYVLPKWHAGMSPQGGISKIVSSPEIAGKMLSRRRHSKPGTTSKSPKLRAKSLFPDQAEKFADSQIPFPARRQKIPCSIRQGIGSQAFEFAVRIHSSAGAALGSRT
jgi:hypothetical protein